MSRQVAIVGDVHGAVGALETAIDWLTTNWHGDVVFVGDYINRGPDSRAVIEVLCQLRARLGRRLTLLMGNHEAALIDFLRTGELQHFLNHGGLQTVSSYLSGEPEPDPFGQFRREFPTRHLELLESLDVAYETPELLVTHCGFNPDRPASRDLQDVVLGSFPALFAPEVECPKPLVVFGHYVQRGRKAFLSQELVCLDSGCGSVPGAPLSVLLLPSRQVLAFGGD